MGNTFAVMNTKGVMGNSPIVVALARSLATLHKKKVLVIDSDAQAGISSMLMTSARLHQLQCQGLTLAGFLVCTVLRKAPALWPQFAVRHILDVEGARDVYLVPSGMQLMLFERVVSKQSLRADLDEAIGRLLKQVRPVFDVVIIDCPAGRSVLAEGWRRAADFHLSLSKAERHGAGDPICGINADNPEMGFATDLDIVINMKDRESAPTDGEPRMGQIALLAPPDRFYNPNSSSDAGHLARDLTAQILACLTRENGLWQRRPRLQTRALA